MSAYSASAPVTASTTEPSAMNAVPPCSTKNCDGVGRRQRARGCPGAATTWRARRPRGRANQTPITGRTGARRRRCRSAGPRTAPVRITSAIGTTSDSRAGAADLEALDGREHRDRGRDHAVAVEQRGAEDAERDQRGLGRAARAAPARWTSAIRAMMPPSPSLSARMMNVMYLIETMIVTAQKTSDRTP